MGVALARSQVPLRDLLCNDGWNSVWSDALSSASRSPLRAVVRLANPPPSSTLLSPDTAEMTALDAADLIALTPAAPAVARRSAPAAPGVARRSAPAAPGVAPRGAPAMDWLERLRADPARMRAVRDSARALVLSRVLVWLAALGAVGVFTVRVARYAFDPPGTTSGFGWLGDLLAAPAARWDGAWYLVIAQHGYRPHGGLATAARAAFFPLYPLVTGVVGELGVPLVLAGVLVSIAALAVALYGLHRLTTLEWGPGEEGGHVARLAVLVCALSPMAFFFSAVYSESLYLALSVGVFWSARTGRFATACALGAFAAATRSAGLVLILPIAMLYLWGPRTDRPPDRRAPRGGWRRLVPRYRVRPDALWVMLVPAGLALYMGYLSLSGGEALMPFHAQEVWNRHFAGPFLGAWDGTTAAWAGLRQLLSMQRHHVFFPAAGGSPMITAGHNLMLFAFLAAAVPATIGVLRTLPLAYGAYVVVALALPLSYPVTTQPLLSLPRFELVLFPLAMWTAAKLAPRPRLRGPALAGMAVLMAVFVAQFATWHWVA